MGSFTRASIFELWLSASGSNTEKHRQVLEQLIKVVPDAENVDSTNLVNITKYVCERITFYWKSCSRMKTRVLNKHSEWLSEKQTVDLPKITKLSNVILDNQPGPSTATAVGRPRKDFTACSTRSKRRRVAALAKLDESTVNSFRDTSTTDSETNEVNSDDVLSLLTEAKLTKHQYLLIRDFINSRKKPYLPAYGKLIEAKKKCYPENIKVTESTAEVELQSLLDHTATRIVDFQKDVLDSIPAESMGNVMLIGKWGFDGSTGHSEYKQNFASSDVTSDGSLFVTSYVPLRLVSTGSTSEDTMLLWKNPRPSSTRYCRPIRFQFIKETKETSVNEQAYLQDKIDKLTPTIIKYGEDKEIIINHCLQLTMVDGKVCSALSDTSNATCFMCKAVPTQMKDVASCIERPIDWSKLEFGLSPLHSWIRFYEYFIHLSYKLGTQKWRATSEDDKKHVALTKKRIQDEFRQRLGLIVDKPRSGGSGTSNDGNTARKFFKNPDVSAQITGIQQSLIERCGTILECISSGYKINTAKYEEYAIETAKQLMDTYEWYPLPSSVHKVLLHGAIVIENALVPIGELSEEAAEATNKNIKMFRRSHTRKMSRDLTNKDLIHRLLLNSDPFITSRRKLPCTKKSTLSSIVLSLLNCTD